MFNESGLSRIPMLRGFSANSVHGLTFSSLNSSVIRSLCYYCGTGKHNAMWETVSNA